MNHFYYDMRTMKPFESRIEALKNLPHSRFYFNDNQFSSVPWSIEPQKTLKQLYLERAQQIRRDYEYIIIAFSGGVDSTNIIETFYYNNIHIDEILVVGAFSQDPSSESDANHNGEIYRNIFPLIKKLNLPNTRITVEDYTKYFNNIENFPLIKNYGSDWYTQIGSLYSVHNMYWNNLEKFIRKNEKKTAVVFGIDKPVLALNENRQYVTYFADTLITSYGNPQYSKDFDKVNFYTSAQSTELMRKQLHILKNFHIITYNIHVKHMSEYFIGKLIYELKNPLNFISPKSPSSILSIRDNYLINKRNEDIYKVFNSGITKLLRSINQSTSNIKNKGIISIVSRNYVI